MSQHLTPLKLNILPRNNSGPDKNALLLLPNNKLSTSA